MIIPLPPILLDFLLALNITLAMTVLLIAMYTLEPLDFSVFPSLLLVMTLYRLSLNVASTRLILLNGDQGERAAGGVIKSFGSFVVGGDYVVGLVVFVILVIINFVVITKGATRIAEVAARFTLDAMPGKQMSIDADLNAGLIDEKQAKDRRARIAQEAEFYGSMDGAAKFVRGDAVAGIIITLINIIGGFVIGVFQRGMPALDAAQTYTLLTIGDGLVSQIPALVISTAAGIVVSRNASDSTMGNEFGKVFFKFPKAVYMASLSIFLFGLIPGLPHLSFISLAVVVAGGMYFFRQRQKTADALTAAEAPTEAIDRGSEPVEHLLAIDPIQMELGYRLIAIVDREQGGDFLERVRSIRRQFALEMGIIIPPIHIRDNLQLDPAEYQVLLKGVKVAGAEIMVGHYLAMDPGDAVQKIDGVPTTEPAFHLPAIWIPESKKEDAKLSGYTVVDNVAVMATHLSEVIRNHAWELIGRQEVQSLLDNLAKSYPKAVEELVPNLLSLGGVQKVLQNLLRERVSVRDLLTIVETLADYAPLTKDHDLLTEYVRHKLARSILEPHIGQDGTLRVITLSQEVEDVLAKGVETTDYGAYLSISPKHADIIASNIKAQADKAMTQNIQPIVLTSPAIRRHLKKMMEYFVPTLIVMSQSELMGDTRIQSIGEVGLSHDR
jgi:flagellar biosynthesis protein FlhA